MQERFIMFTITLPKYISVLMEKLNTAGFEAYVVGGCVRDHLLGLPISDYDMTTNALPSIRNVVISMG